MFQAKLADNLLLQLHLNLLNNKTLIQMHLTLQPNKEFYQLAWVLILMSQKLTALTEPLHFVMVKVPMVNQEKDVDLHFQFAMDTQEIMDTQVLIANQDLFQPVMKSPADKLVETVKLEHQMLQLLFLKQELKNQTSEVSQPVLTDLL